MTSGPVGGWPFVCASGGQKPPCPIYGLTQIIFQSSDANFRVNRPRAKGTSSPTIASVACSRFPDASGFNCTATSTAFRPVLNTITSTPLRGWR